MAKVKNLNLKTTNDLYYFSISSYLSNCCCVACVTYLSKLHMIPMISISLRPHHSKYVYVLMYVYMFVANRCVEFNWSYYTLTWRSVFLLLFFHSLFVTSIYSVHKMSASLCFCHMEMSSVQWNNCLCTWWTYHDFCSFTSELWSGSYLKF